MRHDSQTTGYEVQLLDPRPHGSSAGVSLTEASPARCTNAHDRNDKEHSYV